MMLLAGFLAQQSLGFAALTSAEIVVTEVLNNIVEHALPTTKSGWFSLKCWRCDRFLRFEIADNGTAMPQNRLPAGLAPNVDTALEDLPEGGWGWSMVRSLTQELSYQRVEPVNTLTFSIPDLPDENTLEDMKTGAERPPP